MQLLILVENLELPFIGLMMIDMTDDMPTL